MSERIIRYWSSLRNVILIAIVEILVIQPLAIVWLSNRALAADYTASPSTDSSQTAITSDASCLSIAQGGGGKTEGETGDPAGYDETTTPPPDDTVDADSTDTDTTATTATTVIQSINLSEIRASNAPQLYRDKVLSKEYIQSVFDYYGGRGMSYYSQPESLNPGDTPSEEWIYVCDNASMTIDPIMFDPYSPLPPDAFSTANILEDPTPRIAFANESDKYALLGEKCQGGITTTTLFADWDENTNACPGFQKEDDKNGNGVWDAPKVDRRVIDTALYLVTPASEGGAGREYIRIKQLVKSSKDDPYPQVVQTDSTDTASTEPVVTDPEEDTTTDTTITGDDIKEVIPSSYYIDPSDPPQKPRTLSTSMLIDQIDKYRTSTKVTYKRLFGNNTTEYSVSPPTPVNVSWQSDKGMSGDPPPDVTQPSLLESSRTSINTAIIEMLNQYGLGDLELDVSKMEVNDFGDVAMIVGQSLLETLLGTPKNSLSGWDLFSVLKNIGLSYSEQELGLAPGALADTSVLDGKDTSVHFDDLTKSIGRASLEYALGFPAGSLATKDGTSNSILESLGRTYLEKSIFQVTAGTMASDSADYPIQTIGDLLERLGEGRIESVLKLPKQSLRVKDYKTFRESNLKMKLAFPSRKDTGDSFSDDDYAMADYVSNKLSLSYVPYKYVSGGKTIEAGTSMYGFKEDDFKLPSLRIDPNDPGSLKKFKQLVGSKVIETSIGIFKRSGSTRVLPEADPSLAPVKDLTINGKLLNAQFRPVDDGSEYASEKKLQGDQVGGAPRSGNWCGAAELRYATGQGGVDWVINKDTTDADIKNKVIPGIMGRHGSEHFQYSAQNHSCTQSESVDPYLSGRIEDILFTSAPVNRTIFLNQESAPRYEDLETENNGGSYKGSEEELDGRFNTALLLYYNLQENHTIVPINTVYSGTAQQNAPADPAATPDPASTSILTVAQVLDKLVNGSPATNDGFSGWKADASLKSRIDMMRSLQSTQSASAFFTVNSLNNIPTDQLDTEVIKRLNAITAHPIADPTKKDPYQFKKQYGDTKYNGWSFMLEDLQKRVECKKDNGYYRFNGNNRDDKEGDVSDYSYNATAMGCFSVDGNAEKPDSTSRMEVENAAKRIGELVPAPAAVATRLLAILTTGAIQESLSIDGMSNTDLQAEVQAHQEQAAKAAQSQSAQSVGAGLFSNLPTLDANGRYLTAEECAAAYVGCLYSKDIIRTLAAPGPPGPIKLNASIGAFFERGSAARVATSGNADRSLLGEVGRQVAAHQLSGDRVAQVTFASQLRTDFGKMISEGADILDTFEQGDKEAEDDYGIPAKALEDKGLAPGDFGRIFQYDLADSVFERIGKEELLRTIWKRSGVAQKIQNNEQLQSILRQGRAFARQYSFYRERFDKIVTLSDQLISILDDMGDDYSGALTQLRSVKSKPLRSADAGELRKLARTYEPVMQAIRVTNKKNAKQAEEAEKIAYQISHLTQEIAAGRTLPHDERFNGDSLTGNDTIVGKNATQPINAQECLTPTLLMSTLRSTDSFADKIGTMVVKVGACRLDASFGLANGSAYTWTLLNKKGYELSQVLVEKSKDSGLWTWGPENTIVSWNKGSWDTESMRIAFAIASRVARGKLDARVLDDPFNWLVYEADVETTKELVAEGDKIVQALILSKIVSLIPGIGDVKKLGLTADDFVQIMQGNFKPLAEKYGSHVLDKALGLDQGTSLALLHPTCRDNDDKPAPCSKTPGQPGTDPDFIRTQILAQIGLQKLGISIPIFPKNFDLRAGGNMAVNWGNAVITDDLNLAPNSFKGSMTYRPAGSTSLTDPECLANQLRCYNAEWTLAKAFGLPYSPMLQSLYSIRTKWFAVIDGKDVSMTDEARSAMKEDVDFMLRDMFDKVTFDRLLKSEDFWIDPVAMGTSAGVYMAGIIGTDVNAYADNVRTLWTTASTFRSALGDKAVESFHLAIMNTLGALGDKSAITSGLEAQDEFPEGIFASGDKKNDAMTDMLQYYVDSISRFHRRLAYLDTTYGADAGSFEKLLRGTLKAEDISDKAWKNALANGIGNSIDKWVDDNGPGWLRTANEAFRAYTKVTCPEAAGDAGLGIGVYIATAVNGSNACSLSTNKFTTNDLLYGEGGKDFREILFDNLLSNIFSHKLEGEIGLTKGTFKRMVDDPKRARQILITEGVTILTKQVFGSMDTNAVCPAGTTKGTTKCLQREFKQGLRDSLIAGFCNDYRKDDCELRFDLERASAVFNEMLSNAVYRSLARVGKEYLGYSLDRSDIDRFIHGDLRLISLLGIQKLADALNKELVGKSNKHPNTQFYVANYNTIKESLGFFDLTTDEYQVQSFSYKTAYLSSLVCMPGDLPCYASGADNLRDRYVDVLKTRIKSENPDLSDEEVQDRAWVTADEEIESEGARGVEEYRHEKQAAAKNRLKYTMLDIMLFSRDPNAPPNFSQRMLGMGNEERIDAVKEYLFNMIKNSDSEAGKFLKSICPATPPTGDAANTCYQMFDDLVKSLGNMEDMKAFLLDPERGKFLDTLGTKVEEWLGKQIGINLPAGTLKAIYVWGINGFKKDQFDSDICTQMEPDGKTCKVLFESIGSILVKWGVASFAQWADKALHMKPGTAMRIINVAQQTYNLRKVHDPKQRQEMKMAISKELAAIIVSFIDEDLAKFDAEVGLPAGTTAYVATAAIAFVIATTVFNVSASAAASSCFGPMFWIGLAILLFTGVVSVKVEMLTTGDGYYPWYDNGKGEAVRCIGKSGGPVGGCSAKRPYVEHTPARDIKTGTFSPLSTTAYRQGLKKIAQEKVRGLLIDLLTFPTSKFVSDNGLDTYADGSDRRKSLWISQVFTFGGINQEYDATTRPGVYNLINRNTPWDDIPDFGYGEPETRCKKIDGTEEIFSYDPATNTYTCDREDDFLAGFYGLPTLTDAIHIRW